MRLSGSKVAVACLISCLAIAGCSQGPGRQEIMLSQKQIDEKDDAACRKYGAEPGSAEYISCRVEQGTIRQSVQSSNSVVLRLLGNPI